MKRLRFSGVLGLAALALAGIGTGCVATRVEPSACARAPLDYVDDVQAQVGKGTLRNASIKIEGPFTFVSAEMMRPDDDDDQQGDLLTFVTGDATDPASWRAVDHYALENSSWPKAPFDVTQDGARDSRGCVSYWWGGPYEPDDDAPKDVGDPSFCFSGGDCDDDEGEEGADEGADSPTTDDTDDDTDAGSSE